MSLTNDQIIAQIEAAYTDLTSGQTKLIALQSALSAPVLTPPPTTMADLKGANVYAITGVNGLEALKTATGATHVRCEYGLGSQSAFITEARRLGMKVTMIACYSSGYAATSHQPPDPQYYGAWSDKMVAPLKNNLDVFEAIACWNEPFMPGFWLNPNPTLYHALCRALLPKVRAISTSLPFVFCSDDHIFGDPLNSGTWQNPLLAADSANGNVLRNDPYTRPETHNYCQSDPPDAPRYADHFDRYKLAHDAWLRKVWVTEYGWDTFGGSETSPVSEATQADYTSRALNMMLGSKMVERAHVYQWKADDWYGLRRPDGSNRPVCGTILNL